MSPSAFVLMPFAPEFDEIYNLFIAETLQEAGFDVVRADNLVSQQNIIQDIVVAIRDAALIVADLTGANPNVYYEVGLAHAMGRPTVLLTQSISELPFDLRSYRTITYNTHFAAIKKARAELRVIAAGALDGSVRFGNPVTDYAGSTQLWKIDDGSQSQEDRNSEELGFLDHAVAIEEGFELLVAQLGDMSEQTVTIGTVFTRSSERLAHETEARLPGFTARAREIARQTAEEVDHYTRSLERGSADYATALSRVENSIEQWVAAHSTSTLENRQTLEEMLSAFAQLEDATTQGREGMVTFARSMTSSPNAESRLFRAYQRCATVLNRYVGIVDQTIATLSRARGIADRMLRQASLPTSTKEAE